MRLSLLVIFILCTFNGFSKREPIDIMTPDSVNKFSLKANRLQTQNLNELESIVKEKIDQERYQDALEICKKIEEISITTKSTNWLNISYYYAGICAKNMNELTKALSNFQKLISQQNDPFNGDKEKLFQLYRNTAGVYKGLNNYPEAISYCKKSIELADIKNDKKVIISIYVNMGIMYSSQHAYMEAKECYLNGANLIQTSDDYLSSIIYNNLGNDEYTQGNYAKAIEYYIQSIQLSEKTDDNEMLAYSYNNLGNIYFNGLKNLDMAFEYYTKSLDIERKSKNNGGIAQELNNLGNLYTVKQKYSEAEKSYTEALQIFRSIKDLEGTNNSLENLAVLYSKTGIYNKGITNFLACIEYRKKNNEVKKLASIYNGIGALYYYNKEYPAALNYYLLALELAKTKDDKQLTKQASCGIHETYAQMGLYDKAYKYLQYYSSIKDTLLNATISQQVIDIQEKYERSKMEQKVLLQNLEIKNKSLQRNGIFAVLLIIVLVFSGIVYTVFQKRKNDKLLFDRNAKIKDNEIKNLLKDSEIRSMASMAEGQENERQRISRELHDRVGSMLSLIKLNLSASHENNNPIIEENLALLDQTYQEVRSISHNLYSGLLKTFGLKVALLNLKKTIEAHNSISFNVFFHDEQILFPKEVDEVIYRVIQELITNTLKHAEATSIDIQINTDDDGIAQISVEDNGRGFNPLIKVNEGIGLANIRHRLSSLGGTFEINSSPGNGAFFLLNIPFKTNENLI